MHRFVIRIALRQHMPLRASVEYPEHGLKNLTRRDRFAARTSARNVLFGKVVPNPLPLQIAQPNHSAFIADRQQPTILRLVLVKSTCSQCFSHPQSRGRLHLSLLGFVPTVRAFRWSDCAYTFLSVRSPLHDAL